MPVTIKAANVKYKNSQGQYVGVNSVSDNTTADQLAAINTAGTTQVAAVEAKGTEITGAIEAQYGTLVSDVSTLKTAITASATEETAQEMLSAILSETGLTESALAVIGMTFDALPSDETAQEIRDAIKLEADRLNDIFDLWLAEKESA